MKSIVGDLALLAEKLPTQKVQSPSPAKLVTPATAELQVQFSSSIRKSLRKQLLQLADEKDTTMRAFILNALKEKGLNVEEVVLLDLSRDKG